MIIHEGLNADHKHNITDLPLLIVDLENIIIGCLHIFIPFGDLLLDSLKSIAKKADGGIVGKKNVKIHKATMDEFEKNMNESQKALEAVQDDLDVAKTINILREHEPTNKTVDSCSLEEYCLHSNPVKLLGKLNTSEMRNFYVMCGKCNKAVHGTCQGLLPNELENDVDMKCYKCRETDGEDLLERFREKFTCTEAVKDSYEADITKQNEVIANEKTFHQDLLIGTLKTLNVYPILFNQMNRNQVSKLLTKQTLDTVFATLPSSPELLHWRSVADQMINLKTFMSPGILTEEELSRGEGKINEPSERCRSGRSSHSEIPHPRVPCRGIDSSSQYMGRLRGAVDGVLPSFLQRVEGQIKSPLTSF